MRQVVLEQRHLISDSLAVSRFDHACFKPFPLLGRMQP
jgi:hypothetical protein